MERLKYKKIFGLVQAIPDLKNATVVAPAPFPGRSSPVRVAWSLVVDLSPQPRFKYEKRQPPQLVKLKYIGKPSRLRALEALAFAKKGVLKSSWTAEFDRAGLISWMRWRQGGIPESNAAARFWAYHPQGTSTDALMVFARPVHIKRVGGLSLFSYQKRLTVEQLDKYYDWYLTTFKKKLKRPRQPPMELSGGPEVDL